MSAECRFGEQVGHEKCSDDFCSTHNEFVALCTHAAAALQARVAEQRELAEHQGREALRLEARVRELERDLTNWQHRAKTAEAAEARAEQTVGRLRGRLMAIEQLRIAAAPDSPQVRPWIEVGAEVRAALSLLDAALSPQEPAA